VHDEIVVECDAAIADDIAARVKHAMETAGDFSVPIVADTHIDDRWEK
jgi:DNA polymerase I-like protein with 3'-5' exonuclease and polymerase domains